MSAEPDQGVAVEITVSCETWRSSCPDAENLAATAARAAIAGVAVAVGGPLTIGILLTDDAEQRRLNRAYRGKDSSTNVLAFPVADPAVPGPAGSPILLGDVVLAFETVCGEAGEQKKTLPDHLRHLVVHGVLHLLGFDHETETDANKMEACEVEILAGLGVPAPYDDTI